VALRFFLLLLLLLLVVVVVAGVALMLLLLQLPALSPVGCWILLPLQTPGCSLQHLWC
jgi:hypothetical protein